ncbi:hypothetical protein GDO78_017028 [Eleutherodactylus coqui]|uniref:Uncharacterized protein n=1 Tax=Eleutherodactylus coqui TaxID=57060 RepID=A0A8J6K0G1_ELECQ|nr:hypothetical protein GDO78_017028 [Eleutherodactylus coqui]
MILLAQHQGICVSLHLCVIPSSCHVINISSVQGSKDLENDALWTIYKMLKLTLSTTNLSVMLCDEWRVNGAPRHNGYGTYSMGDQQILKATCPDLVFLIYLKPWTL